MNGEAFLTYVLGLAEADLRTLEPTQPQREVIGVLAQVAAAIPQDESGLGRYHQLSNPGRWQEESGSSIANALPVHAGASCRPFLRAMIQFSHRC